MKDESGFIRCYRKLLDSYRLTPEASEKLLAEILKRICQPQPRTPAEHTGG